MRWNPGGLLPQAVDVAGMFLPRGSLVVSTRGRPLNIDQNRDFPSTADPVLPMTLPLVVLVNYASASAAEIVAGAIQDWDRGVIVGDTTFGKGSVQTPLQLDKKYTLKLTTAYYYTPSGRCINRPENAVHGAAAADSGGDTTDDDSAANVKSESGKTKRDTTRYLTKNGRAVYGGGGIIPDTVVRQEIPNMVIRTLFGKDVFFRFANLEYVLLKKNGRIAGGKIAIDEDIMKDFERYLDSIKFTYESYPQVQFNEFKRRSELVKDTGVDSAVAPHVVQDLKPRWTDREKEDLKKAAGVIDTLLAHESRRALAENGKDIRKYLYEALLVRHYGQDNEAYFRWKLSDDPQVKTAVGFLIKKDDYASLLKPRPAKGPAVSGKK
jgi:carboxyl-terminal processing protease